MSRKTLARPPEQGQPSTSSLMFRQRDFGSSDQLHSRESSTPEAMDSDNEYTVVMGRRVKRMRQMSTAEWTEGQTKLLLEYYYKYFPQIGPFKKFKNKKQAFKQISMDVEAILGIKKTPEQCENRYKTVIRRRKAASDNNNRSGASPSPVPFDDEIRKIETIDDSIEPEVQRDASGVIFKDSPESPSLVSPNAESIEKSESQSPNADVKPRSSTVRLQHMQLFFSEMKAINEERECRKAARDAEKENRRAQRQVERQALLDERRKMHNEKMEILRQAFGLQK
ncbi:hypothetical protein HPB49_020178 [Dermacentor silvarum]|uniref:Uncharacterized protein n=1 Tax=Dermacentor silvarum TaxID=543639 RepID=A0ACB8CBA0_DERSI|nr:hypothetical protein HPB49_020178 [Dermacentor silvarum]